MGKLMEVALKALNEFNEVKSAQSAINSGSFKHAYTITKNGVELFNEDNYGLVLAKYEEFVKQTSTPRNGIITIKTVDCTGKILLAAYFPAFKKR